jgi:hypothetical protein
MAETQGIVVPATTEDGKSIVLHAVATTGFRTLFTGAGDDLSSTPPESGRANGTKLRLTFDGAGVPPIIKFVEIQFKEVIEIHDGQLFYTPSPLGGASNWTPNDSFSFMARMPATVVTPASPGNVILVNAGGYNVIVPSANGTHNVDLTAAVPVPANNAGYWDVNDNGTITASTNPGKAAYHLLDVQVTSYFIRNLPMGAPMGTFDIDVYGSQRIHPTWFVRLEVKKADLQTGEVAAWLMTFRKMTT